MHPDLHSGPILIPAHVAVTKTPKWEEKDELSQKAGPHATVYLINGDRYLGEWQRNQKHGAP